MCSQTNKYIHGITLAHTGGRSTFDAINFFPQTYIFVLDINKQVFKGELALMKRELSAFRRRPVQSLWFSQEVAWEVSVVITRAVCKKRCLEMFLDD